MAKIPKQAQKVFSGVLFNTYQWEQELYDGSTTTFEMLERKPVVDLIALVGDKIMILREEQPTKPLFESLPAGGVEPGDTFLQTAAKELIQETGYKAKRFRQIGEFFGNSKMFYHQLLYVAEDCYKVSEQNLDAGEKVELTLRDFDYFLNCCRDPKFTCPLGLKFMMYEALLDKERKEELRSLIYG